jgi:acyl carrier protein
MEIKKFINHFAGIFDEVQADALTESTKFRDLNEWDSMHALSLMAMVDEQYKIKLSPTEIKEAITIGDIFKAVSQKVK